MPSITSIVNSLLRLLPGDDANAIYKCVMKLHPQGENLSDPEISHHTFVRHLQAWHTRHAYESCRGWRWPYWLQAQGNVLSQSWTDISNTAGVINRSNRDGIAIPGIFGTFSGTMDRRGMITPRHGRFSLETWFRIGDNVFQPSSLFDERRVSYSCTPNSASCSFQWNELAGEITVRAILNGDTPVLELRASCRPAVAEGHVISIYFAIRPYTMESVVPLPDLVYNSSGFWMLDSRIVSWCPEKPAQSWASDAKHDDAAMFLNHPPDRTAVRCPAGLATAVMDFQFQPGENAQAQIYLPLDPIIARSFSPVDFAALARSTSRPDQPESIDWAETGLALGETQLAALTDFTDISIRSSWLEQNHWLAAAVLGLISQGNVSRARGLLSYVFLSQQKNGYLAVSGGHWSLAGQALMAIALLGNAGSNDPQSYKTVRATARWIMRKRREIAHSAGKPRGLLPPGVTRSGVGTEYNLVDNLWCLEGLYAAAGIARDCHEHHDAEMLYKDAEVFSARISAAVHRELEFGFRQLAPGRLMRAFDATSASELLDLALMPNARRLLKSDDWFGRIVQHLASPLTQPSTEKNLVTLRNIDQTGVRPGRRMLLCLALLQRNDPLANKLFGELEYLMTPMGTWTESVNLDTRCGNGQAIIDIEATAMFQVLANWQKHGSLTNNPRE